MRNLKHALQTLGADPEAISWTEREKLVDEVFACPSDLARHSSGPALELLELLARDPKWEVRKEVAERINALPEDSFSAFASTLSQDENSFVRSAAQRSLERHRKGQKINEIKGRKLRQMEADLVSIEREFGPDAALKVRRATQALFEKFVGTTVHELRSVLTSLIGNIEALEQASHHNAAAAINRYAPRLRTQTAFMEKLFDDMRDYTRVLSPERKPERVADMIAEAISMVRAQLEAEKIECSSIALMTDLDGDILFPSARMEMVIALRNVIKNAFDAFLIDAKTLGSGTISIRLRQEERVIRITVADTGMGLAEREREKISYFIPTSSSKGQRGTGYGLAIAHRNITAHGGRIELQSAEDEGTTVTIDLDKEGGQSA